MGQSVRRLRDCLQGLALAAPWLVPAAAAAEGEAGSPRLDVAAESARQVLLELLVSGREALREVLAADPGAAAALGLGVVGALVALQAVWRLVRGRQERRRRSATQRPAHPVTDRRRQAVARSSARVAEASRPHLDDPELMIEPIEQGSLLPVLPRRVNGSERTSELVGARSPLRKPVQPTAAAMHAASPARRPNGEDRQPAAPGHAGSPASTSPPPATRHRASEARAGGTTPADRDPDLPVLGLPDPMDSEGRISQCFAFLAEGRFEDAVGITREGLNGHPDAGRVLGQLSRVASLLGRDRDAIELAAKAYKAERSDERLKSLLQLRSAAHRFGPRAGEQLRLAVARDPEEPVYLRALGIFEALHGDRAAARRLLRAALRHETGQEVRGAIARELLQVEQAEDLAAQGERLVAPQPPR